MHSNRDQLKSMRELRDFQVSREDPDVRGWTVVAADGQRVGTVNDLIVDTGRMKVAYLAIEEDSDGQSSMVPVESARLQTSDREVVIDRLTEVTPWSDTASAARVDERDVPRAGIANHREAARLTRPEEELRIGRREVNVQDTRTVGTEIRREEFDVDGDPETLVDDVTSDRRGGR
jgi:sporulation protein YlmC with PRC-barrel domain